MRVRCLPLIGLILAITPLLAQQKPTTKPATDPIVLGKMIMDRRTGETFDSLHISGYVRRAQPLSRGLFLVGAETVDIARGTRLAIRGAKLVHSNLKGEPIWTRAIQEIQLDRSTRHEHRLIVGDRIILPRHRGGWTALHRDNGKIAWQSKDGPNEVLLVNRGLVIAAGRIGKEHILQGWSLRNGGAAFRNELPGPARQIVAARLGIAVIGKGWLRVFDRFGPSLLEMDRDVEHVAACRHGWILVKGNEVSSVDRSGKLRWTTTTRANLFLSCKSVQATGRGSVLIASYHDMSDSGAHCELLSTKDGKPLWTVRVAGLQVAHSKYFHHVDAHVRDDCIDIVSQASGGAFLEVLDIETGSRVLRARPK